jgi:hypothetical protein
VVYDHEELVHEFARGQIQLLQHELEKLILPNDELKEELISRGVIGLHEDVFDGQFHENERSKKVVDVLARRSSEGGICVYRSVLAALKECGQNHVANFIRRKGGTQKAVLLASNFFRQ